MGEVITIHVFGDLTQSDLLKLQSLQFQLPAGVEIKVDNPSSREDRGLSLIVEVDDLLTRIPSEDLMDLIDNAIPKPCSIHLIHGPLVV